MGKNADFAIGLLAAGLGPEGVHRLLARVYELAVDMRFFYVEMELICFPAK